ncbi:AIPR family protein [Pseudofrankia sp. BMG5.37]|uniref:AIPR family protein n=1 Tax=Pseudofrankia sp. BMG5.37 TaxID=3050035 RepID=UPI002893E74C|nr:AIPR family protein [Pseudofrankia sp. BMG5.37]MDT3444349.1 AIPR family protein [Pseudofrankia sp. BMG5.37]
MNEGLASFAASLVADVEATADAEGGSAPHTFTRRVLDDLENAGETEETFVAFHKARVGRATIEVSGFGFNHSLESLDLFVTSYRLPGDNPRLTGSDADVLFRRLENFLARCDSGLAKSFDESSDIFDMCTGIAKSLGEVSRIRLFLITNQESSASASFPPGRLGDIPISYHVWDITRLYRLANSGTLSEPISVIFDEPVACLQNEATDDYSIVLAVVPGKQLSALYGRYGSRLLELNVRSFLQTRGEVNSGIRTTINRTPERFLAYNNGLTTTGSAVRFVTLDSGGLGISRIDDFQIVNGGQTTASLHYAETRDRANLDKVLVQMKLVVVRNDELGSIVPEISRYSNNQNKVTLVDFSSNKPFHVALEKVSRSLWAPAKDGSSQQTQWFYERARGQYVDALANERTPAAQSKFKAIHPTTQKFGKSDVAKYFYCWNQRPHSVTKGAQKNFNEFTIDELDGEVQPVVDAQYCTRLLAAAILFKAIDKIVGTHGYGSHKSYVTAYTMSRLSLATDKRIDLDRIWRTQRISSALHAAVEDLCDRVGAVVEQAQRGKHVGEWAKHAECWAEVARVRWGVPADLAGELVASPVEIVGEAAADAPNEDVEAVVAIPARVWFTLALWANESKLLEPYQRQLAFTLGTLLRRGEHPNPTQAGQARRTLLEARDLGFRTAHD